MSDEERINSYNLRRATKRLNRELNIITKDPIPGIDLRANEDNILEWHFVIHGKEDTPYYGGMYHGKLIFPSNFPFGPPKIIFLTPNGRFKTNERICFSLSDFHPEEWKPAFSVTTVLQGITDFMHDSTETIGSIETSESVKKQLADSSSIHNGKDAIFCHLFPQLCGRKLTDSEDSSSESSPPKSPTATSDTKISPTLPEREVLIKITPPSPPPPSLFRDTRSGEKEKAKEAVFFREESSSPRGIVQTSGEESPISSGTIIKQITPTHTTPLQNVSQDSTDPIPKSLDTNSQIPENIELEKIPADIPSENRKLPSLPINIPDAADSQRRLPSLPKEKIPSPETKVSPVRENIRSPDEISLPTRTQSQTSTEITSPPTHLTPVPSEITSPPPEETLTSKDNQKESSSPDEIIKTFRKEPSGAIQEQRTITPPTHTTPSVPKPMFYPVKCPEAQPSSREVRPLSQNVSPLIPFIRSPIKSKKQNSGENSQTLESNELDVRRAHSFSEYGKRPSPLIKSSGATHSQRNLPSSPKDIIPQIGTVTFQDIERAHRQDVDTRSLRHHMFQPNIRTMDFTIGALVFSLILILILGLLLIALLFLLP